MSFSFPSLKAESPPKRTLAGIRPPNASRLPSGEKAKAKGKALTSSSWRSSVCGTTPEPASHRVTVLLPNADAGSLPSREKATPLTQLEWPASVCRAGVPMAQLYDLVIQTPAACRPATEGQGVDPARIALERLSCHVSR